MCVCTYQGCGQAQDGQQGAGGGKGGVLADSCLLPHLHIRSCDVISQTLWDDGLLLFTLTDVSPGPEPEYRHVH